MFCPSLVSWSVALAAVRNRATQSSSRSLWKLLFKRPVMFHDLLQRSETRSYPCSSGVCLTATHRPTTRHQCNM
ncbi:hypothetical protein C8R44DRAFT_769847 [Mycena epipterygia]|nr:hypothetical protein C8R44DRAFT_769847 [Mycena epipterygia]